MFIKACSVFSTVTERKECEYGTLYEEDTVSSDREEIDQIVDDTVQASQVYYETRPLRLRIRRTD